MQVSFIRQQEMKGTGHALMLMERFAGGEPVIVVYPDDVLLGKPGLSKQLIEAYKATGKTVLAVEKRPINELQRYGVVDLSGEEPKNGNFPLITGMVEKPKDGQAPSQWISIGRYLYTAEFYEHLRKGWH